MASDSVKVSLDISTKAAEIALKKFQDETRKADGFLQSFKGNLGANIAFTGIKGVIGGVQNFVGSLIEESAKAELSQKKLSVALQAAGFTSEQTFKELKDYADELERTTNISGETAEASMTLLASLTNLDKNGIKQATAASADLATTLGIDLESATQLIIKGINGQTTSLERYGIKVRAGSDETQNFTNILKELGKFQGAAAKSSETFIGAQTQLENQTGKLYESIGNLITQNPIVIAGYNEVTKILIFLSETIENNKDDIILFTNSLAASTVAVGITTAAIAVLGTGLGGLTTAFTLVSAAARVAWTAITGPIGIAVAAIVGVGTAIYGIVKYWDDVKIAVYETIAATLEYAATAAKLASGKLAESLKAQAAEFKNKAQAVRDAVKAQQEEIEAQRKAEEEQEKRNQESKESALLKKQELESYKAFAQALIKQNEDIDKSNKQKIEQSKANAEFEQEQLKAQLELGLINYYDYQVRRDQIDAEFAATRQAIVDSQYSIEQEKLKAARDNNLINDEAYQTARLQLEKNYANEKQKVDNEIAKKDFKNKQDQLKAEKSYSEAKLSMVSGVFGSIASIAELGGRKTFEVVKAFNLAEAITSGILSVQKAAASAPPPFNVPAIVQAAAFSAANIAKISAAKPSGFAGGGVVGGFQGATSGPDTTQITARTGEMILNASQQRSLFDRINSGSTGDVIPVIERLITAIESQSIVVNVGGKTVVDTIRSELSNGRSFA